METQNTLASGNTLASFVSAGKRPTLDNGPTSPCKRGRFLKRNDTPDKLDMPRAKKKAPFGQCSHQQLTADSKALVGLFHSLDATLVQYLNRQKRCFYEDIRVEIETAARHAFTQERLSQILALANGGLVASWAQLSTNPMPGASAARPLKLELKQNINGETRPPSPSELRVREEEFLNALMQVEQKREELPSLPLPELPSAQAKTASHQFRPVADLKKKFEEMWEKADTQGSSALDRMQALRARARKREDIWNAHEAEQTTRSNFTKAVSSYSNAEVVLNVVVSLFSSRQQVKEKEVITILCSNIRHPMSSEDAHAALEEFVACSEGFVQRVESKWDAGLFYLQRIPSGYPRHVSDRLRAKRAELQRTLEDSCISMGESASASTIENTTPQAAEQLQERPRRRLRTKGLIQYVQ